MIIKYPTGLYNIPKGTELGNVTFTVSNNSPPRSNLLFSKIPDGIARKQILRRDEVLWRRETVGDLVFNISESRRTTEGTNNKTFETGQVLEFNDGTSKTVDEMLVGNNTTTQHNITRIDYDQLDIDDEDKQLIDSVSFLAYKSLGEDLNNARQRYRNYEQDVIEFQKIINNSTRTINALKIAQDQNAGTDIDVSDLISKLEIKRDEAFRSRDAAIASANQASAESTSILDRLRTISTVLK